MEFEITICIPANNRFTEVGNPISVTNTQPKLWTLFRNYFRKCTAFFGSTQAFLHVFFILFCEYQHNKVSQMICEKLKNRTFAKIGYFAQS